MQLSTLLALSGAAGLALTVPTKFPNAFRARRPFSQSNSSPAVALHAVNARDNTYSCGLTNYQDATQGPVSDGIVMLRGDLLPATSFQSMPNDCIEAWVSYGTGFMICDTSGTSSTFQSPDVANMVSDLVSQCLGDHELHDGGDSPVNAMQYFGDGFNILVKGGY